MIRRRVLSLLSLAAGFGGLERVGAQAALRQPNLVGLTIGIDAYEQIPPLQTARQDADSVARRLSDIGYTLEPHPEDPSSDSIAESFGNFLQRIDSGSAAFLFLAGHGVQVEGRNFFLPGNTPRLNNADALAEAFPLDFFLESIAKARPRQAIVVLDACRDNAVGKSLPDFQLGLASTRAPRNCFVAYSASSGEYALDRLSNSDASPNGLFTRHLIRNLEGERPIYDIIKTTGAQVIAEAETVGHRQHPAIYDQSRRTFFLDGVERRDSGTAEDPIGTLEGVGIVLVASDDYDCMLRPLRSPKPDSVRLHRVLTGLGASVVGMFNPSRAQVLEACTQMAGRSFDRQVFIWLGRGAMKDVQAAALFESGACQAIASGKKQGSGLSVLTHSDVVEAFRPSPDPQEKARSAIQIRPLTMIFDCGLERDPDLAMNGGYSTAIRLNDLPAEFMLEERYHDIALLAATQPGRAKPAATDRIETSPMVTALINALGRPGLSLLDLSELVIAEVETLTDGEQKPLLVASPKSARRPFVGRKAAIEES